MILAFITVIIFAVIFSSCKKTVTDKIVVNDTVVVKDTVPAPPTIIGFWTGNIGLSGVNPPTAYPENGLAVLFKPKGQLVAYLTTTPGSTDTTGVEKGVGGYEFTGSYLTIDFNILGDYYSGNMTVDSSYTFFYGSAYLNPNFYTLFEYKR